MISTELFFANRSSLQPAPLLTSSAPAAAAGTIDGPSDKMISNAGTGSSLAALNTTSESPYFKYPFTLLTLPGTLQHGLVALGVMGLLSMVATTSLLALLAYRFLTRQKADKVALKSNQYLILFLNLLIADAIQAASFVLSFWWLHLGGILAPTPACQIQGTFLNIGNVGSGFFVLFIACHTFYTAVMGERPGQRLFFGLVAAVWALAILLTIIGPALHGRDYFVRTGAWCWASALYEVERLTLHYMWIFFVQFASMIIYLAVFIHIKTTMARTSVVLARSSGRNKSISHAKISRAARSMLLYPLTYVVLTLPLSAGRMWSLAHEGAFLPNAYVIVAGTLIASNGLTDCLLYTATRRQIMSSASTTSGSHVEAANSLNNTAPEASASRDEKPRMSRPSFVRAISARSLKPLGANPVWDDKGSITRSVSVGVNLPAPRKEKPDPYGLDTIDLERAVPQPRSVSVPAIVFHGSESIKGSDGTVADKPSAIAAVAESAAGSPVPDRRGSVIVHKATAPSTEGPPGHDTAAEGRAFS